jgi:hypothetical protein
MPYKRNEWLGCAYGYVRNTVVRIASANAKQAEALTMPLDDGGRLDQNHRV